MKIEGVVNMIHKNGNLLDRTVTLPLKQTPLYKELINNNNSVIINKNVIEDEQNNADSNDDNNNDFDSHESKYFKCPICQSDDFSTIDFLDDHVKNLHPNYKPSCKDCGEVFASLKLLTSHSIMHVTDGSTTRNPINLKILNFLENKNSFYQKFTESIEISQSYRCNFCSEHFTGAHFMAHWKQCKHFQSDDSNSKLSKEDFENEDVKSNFLAGLNLQSKPDSLNSSDTESNRSLRSEKTDEDTSKTPSKLITAIHNATATYSKQAMFFGTEDDKNYNHEEEDDDPFKVEVRDMKRRGEFPCRICKKIFRNLRALKGHARIHISGNRGMRPYECNICSFSTTDKSIVIRHIRNHNGDHPYKCQLCYSTFTTKANCERHLRNAHRKTSREDIKKLLLDLNNKPQNNSSVNFRNKLQSLLTTGLVKVDEKDELRTKFAPIEFYKVKCQNEHVEEDEKSAHNLSFSDRMEQKSEGDDSNNSNDSNNNTNSSNSAAKKLDEYHQQIPLLKPSSYKYANFSVVNFLDLSMRPEKKLYESNSKMCNDVRVGVSPVVLRDNGFIQLPPYENQFKQSDSDIEEPLDLSVDILDLSKKKENMDEVESGAEDLTVKNREYESASSVCKNLPQPHPVFYDKNDRYGFTSNPVMQNLSTLFVPNMNLPSGFSVPKTDPEDDIHNAKIRPLIFGQLVANAAEHYDNIRQNVTPFVDYKKVNCIVQQSEERDEKANEKFDAKFKDAVTVIKPRTNKSSTIKMVMKDGVLVEKQKQRRYRTEKPFSCAYCSGRFTLRSNMDRHVKQQHPGFWRQRQRGGSGRSQRNKSKDESMESISVKSESQVSQPEELQDIDGSAIEKRSHDASDVDIDDEIGYKTNKKYKRDEQNENVDDDDEDEEELVIDEEIRDQEMTEEKIDIISNMNSKKDIIKEENPDLASVRSLLDNVSTQTFSQYFRNEEDANNKHEDNSEEDEEGLVAGSSSEGNGSGGEENRSTTEVSTKPSDKNADTTKKKKSAYSSAPNRVHCDFCYRSFPWASSLRRHTLTHTGQKPYKCSNCPLLFTTKSNCDRHFLRKHRSQLNDSQPTTVANLAGGIENERSSSKLIPNFSTRNVPERPFKCSHCPSSTFSTFQNLKKHIIEKHNQSEVKNEESPICIIDGQCIKKEETLNVSENSDMSEKSISEEREWKSTASNYEQNFCGHVSSDLPFKCHLCDRSFGERQEALDHMSESHSVEFQHLICKGALDMNVKLEDSISHEDATFANANSDENNMEQGRGRFPDYSSRKVICAFCLRRFWSAEDLRRHMRTHTGERPFACDICQRRFTLKHSMLRHRKKHSNKSFASTSGENSPNSDDEESCSPFGDNRDMKLLTLATVKTELQSNCGKTSEYELSQDTNEDTRAAFLPTEKNISKVCNKSAKEDGVDLIAKLLDIDDKELVDEMLTSKSADDVAKLLGVQK